MKIGLHTHLRPGAEERYEENHRNVWPDVLHGAHDLSGKGSERMSPIFDF